MPVTTSFRDRFVEDPEDVYFAESAFDVDVVELKAISEGKSPFNKPELSRSKILQFKQWFSSLFV